MGLMGYDGHLTFRVDPVDRERLALAANTILVEPRNYVQAAGLAVCSPNCERERDVYSQLSIQVGWQHRDSCKNVSANGTTFKEEGVAIFTLP